MNADTEMLLGSFDAISSISFRNGISKSLRDGTPATLNSWLAFRFSSYALEPWNESLY